MNKAGLQLSINFIVIFILAIVIIGFGLSIFTQLFNSVEELPDRISENQRRQLQELLRAGTPVAVAPSVQEVSRDEDPIYSVAIQNDYGDEHTFNVTFKEQSAPPASTLGVEDFIFREAHTIAPGERAYVPFKIVVGDARPGSYIYNVTVKNETHDTYYQTQKVILNVR
jgi:hypothetical protein